jgi:phosphate-selective porin OprO/OprP
MTALRRLLLASTTVAGLAWAVHAQAQDQPQTTAPADPPPAQAPSDPTAARIAALENALNDLQAQISDLKASQVASIADIRTTQNATTVSIANGKPTIASGDGAFSATLHGVMQLDTAIYSQSSNLPSSVTTGRDLNSGTNFRRGRLGIDGKIFTNFDYNILLDFGGSGTDGATTLHELWIQYSGFKPFKFRVGAFPPNLGLEDAASTNGSMFPERPSSAEVARNLAGADKRIAAQALAQGEHWLIAGAVTGAKATDAATFDEQLGYTFRAAATPLHGYDWLVHVGANASYVAHPAQTTSGAAGIYPITLQDRPELRVDGTSLVSTGAIDAKTANHWGLELAGQKAGVTVQGEYFSYNIQRRNAAVGFSDPSFSGWYVEGGWVITGEQRKYNYANGAFDAPAIARPFDPASGSWGAFELAARYSVLDLNDSEFSTTSGNRVRGGDQKIWTLGVNWFLNPAVKFQLDYLDVSIDRLDGSTPAKPAGQDYHVINLRSQFAF